VLVCVTTACSSIPLKVMLESFGASKAKEWYSVANGNGNEESKEGRSLGRTDASSASWQEVTRIRLGFWRYSKCGRFQPRVFDEGKPGTVGQAEKESHEQHPQHVKADQRG
jgi:hypothetical protein